MSSFPYGHETTTRRHRQGPTALRADYREPVKKIWPFLVSGAILGVVGLIWTLQGVGILGGSAMSGESLWAIIGPIVLLAGVGLLIVGMSRRRDRAR
jgi:hypothetical protein